MTVMPVSQEFMLLYKDNSTKIEYEYNKHAEVVFWGHVTVKWGGWESSLK